MSYVAGLKAPKDVKSVVSPRGEHMIFENSMVLPRWQVRAVFGRFQGSPSVFLTDNGISSSVFLADMGTQNVKTDLEPGSSMVV